MHWDILKYTIIYSNYNCKDHFVYKNKQEYDGKYALTEEIYTPIALLEQESRFLRPILLVSLWLVDAVTVARVFPIKILLRGKTKISNFC